MIVYDVPTKLLDTRDISSAQHRWHDLWHYIYCFVQSGEAFMVERKKHTHTQQLSRLRSMMYNTLYM